jgi:hypothetical protein
MTRQLLALVRRFLDLVRRLAAKFPSTENLRVLRLRHAYRASEALSSVLAAVFLWPLAIVEIMGIAILLERIRSTPLGFDVVWMLALIILLLFVVLIWATNYLTHKDT